MVMRRLRPPPILTGASNAMASTLTSSRPPPNAISMSATLGDEAEDEVRVDGLLGMGILWPRKREDGESEKVGAFLPFRKKLTRLMDELGWQGHDDDIL